MFAGVGLQFGPIDSHMPKLDQSRADSPSTDRP
jgi:hypothetical protein